MCRRADVRRLTIALLPHMGERRAEQAQQLLDAIEEHECATSVGHRDDRTQAVG